MRRALLALLAFTLAAPAAADDAARFLVKRDGKYGAIDVTGKLVVEPQYDGEFHFADGLARVAVGSKVGYIDTAGKIAISPNARIAKGSGEFAEELPLAALISGDFADGLAPFVLDGKYGYVDKRGAVAIKPAFEKAESFVEGLALVAVDGGYGSIDKTGRFVIEPRFDRPYRFAEGLAVVRIEGGFGYIDRSGKIVIPGEFNYAYNFSGGRARAQIKRAGGEYGYIDRAGKVAIHPPELYKISSDFRDGRAKVRSDKAWGFIDDQGKFAIPAQFFSAGDFSGGLAQVAVGDFQKHRWGFVDRAGKLAVPAQYDHVEDFSEGLAAVLVRGEGYSYVDGSGTRVIGPLADVTQADAFGNGLARVWFSRRTDGEGVWGYIDRKGKRVWKGER